MSRRRIDVDLSQGGERKTLGARALALDNSQSLKLLYYLIRKKRPNQFLSRNSDKASSTPSFCSLVPTVILTDVGNPSALPERTI